MLNCTVINNTLIPRDNVSKHLLLKHEGKDIVVKRVEPTRTQRQNAFFWVCMTELALHCGYSNKENFKKMLMKEIGHCVKAFNPFTGEDEDVDLPTKDLSISKFRELIEKVKDFAEDFLDFKIVIPDEFKNQK